MKGSEKMQYDTDTFEKLVKKEKSRLTRMLVRKESPTIEFDKKRAQLLAKLIEQAARLSILQDDAWLDITKNGSVELFSQSANAIPYERERPISKQYTTYAKQYQSVMKMLAEMFAGTEELIEQEVSNKNSAREWL